MNGFVPFPGENIPTRSVPPGSVELPIGEAVSWLERSASALKEDKLVGEKTPYYVSSAKPLHTHSKMK